MFYILHGENDLQRAEVLAQWIEAAGVPADLRDLNTEVLNPPVSAGQLKRACSVMPFLGGARLVIAPEALTQSAGETAQAIADYLQVLPETTHLFLVERAKVRSNHAVMKLAQKLKTPVVLCALPSSRELPGWIQQRVGAYHKKIEPGAAELLAQNIGANLRILDQEIQKLLLYIEAAPSITAQDVHTMVPYVQSADVIFDLVDALGQRDARRAAIYLHRLLDAGESPLGMLGMIVRQFRLLIQARWLRDRNAPANTIAERLSLHPYVAQKVTAQVTHFTPTQLRRAYGLLLQCDLDIKTGKLDPEAALDLLCAELTTL